MEAVLCFWANSAVVFLAVSAAPPNDLWERGGGHREQWKTAEPRPRYISGIKTVRKEWKDDFLWNERLPFSSSALLYIIWAVLKVFHIGNNLLLWHFSMFVPGFICQQMYLINNKHFFTPHVSRFNQSSLAVGYRTHIAVVAEKTPLCHPLAVLSEQKKRRKKKTCKFAQIDPSISLSAESSACCPGW